MCRLTAAEILDTNISEDSLSSYYMAAMLNSAGITDEHKVLALNGVNPVLCFLGAILGARMTDVLGRRPLLLYTTVFCSVCFAVITGTSKLATEDPSATAAANTTVAFIFIFGSCRHLYPFFFHR